MANEITTESSPGLTLWGELVNGVTVWNTSGTPAFGALASVSAANRAITLTEQNSEGLYAGTMPATAVGQHVFYVRRQAGASRSLTADPRITRIDLDYWNGTAFVKLVTTSNPGGDAYSSQGNSYGSSDT